MTIGGSYNYGFRILGRPTERRKVCNFATAFEAYADVADAARVDEEAYLSAFAFGPEFVEHLRATGTPRDFAGACRAPWAWLDIDRDGDPAAALDDAKSLAYSIPDRLGVAEEEVLCFFSGGKGFHLGIPLDGLGESPSTDTPAVVRRLCEDFAAAVGVAIDAGIYDAVRPFRAPNSRHPKTGLHKRHLSVADLVRIGPAAVAKLAERPAPFEIRETTPRPPALQKAWDAARREVAAAREAATEKARAIEAGEASHRLVALTRDFIANGAAPGGGGADHAAGNGRHRRAFAAAANLAECGAPLTLTMDLLLEPALDCGLAPRDAERQIREGFDRGRRKAVMP